MSEDEKLYVIQQTDYDNNGCLTIVFRSDSLYDCKAQEEWLRISQIRDANDEMRYTYKTTSDEIHKWECDSKKDALQLDYSELRWCHKVIQDSAHADELQFLLLKLDVMIEHADSKRRWSL